MSVSPTSFAPHSESPEIRDDGSDTSYVEAMWFLVGQLPNQDGTRHIPIHISPFSIGRGGNATFCLPCSTVSSLHAELSTDGDKLMLRDKGSTNGTFVNGTRLRDSIELKPDDLVLFASNPFRIMRQSVSTHMGTVAEDACDKAMALIHFDRLLSEQAVDPHYQAIVKLTDGEPVGYEVLARSKVPGLESAGAMFSAATKLNLESQLSQMMRWRAVVEIRDVDPMPHLFLNTHPSELAETALLDSMAAIRQHCPKLPITLEIHEAAVSSTEAMRELRDQLRSFDISLAFDDFGAGQARLAELSEVHPDYLKFDMSFVRDIHRSSAEKFNLVEALVKMVKAMDIVPLAEGIEVAEERDACLRLGFELAQGYFFGRPVPLQR